jgi:predicted DNA-binding transcriptional regulator AlpA
MATIQERIAALRPERVGWEGVCQILGTSVSSAKRLLLIDPAFPKPFRASSRVLRFVEADIRAYAEMRQREPLDIGSLRGAVEAKALAEAKARRAERRATATPK